MGMTELEKLIVSIYARCDGSRDGWWCAFKAFTDLSDCLMAVNRLNDADDLRDMAQLALEHSIFRIREAA